MRNYLTTGDPTIDGDAIELVKKHGEEFTSLNRLATFICKTPVSLVNVLDKNFQFNISKYGKWEGHTTPKEETVCQFTVEDEEILVIQDTRTDDRTSSITEIIEDDSIRFYAGVPIKSPRGHRIGAFCVIDSKPKKLSDVQRQALIDLGKEVELRIRLLKQKKELEFKNRKLQEAAAFLNNSTDILLVVDPITFKVANSVGAKSILDSSDSSLIGMSLFDLIDEINIKNHIKQWVKGGDRNDKLGLPVRLNKNFGDDIWLNLIFSNYKDSLLITGRDITRQQRAEHRLKESLEEKEVLLSEVHHRVKNNLAVVMSLIQLERFNSDNEVVSNILHNSESRIISIAKIHELLYQSNDFSSVQFESYVTELIDYLEDTFDLNRKNISITLRITDFSINVNQALPVGLIINELVTNSIKHAFGKSGGGNITITIVEEKDDQVRVEVSDDGIGLDIDTSKLSEQSSLGFTLINTLAKQLRAEFDVENGNGSTFVLTFQKNDQNGSVSTYRNRKK